MIESCIHEIPPNTIKGFTKVELKAHLCRSLVKMEAPNQVTSKQGVVRYLSLGDER